MRKKRILTKLTKLLTGFVFFGLTCIFGETSLRAEELSIGITRGNNISVLIKEGEVYYTNEAITFYIDDYMLEGQQHQYQYEYALSSSKGENFSDWIEMEQGKYQLVPDQSNEWSGIWYIKFRRIVQIQESISENEIGTLEDVISENEINEEETGRIDESREYRVCFDMKSPVISLSPERKLEQWSTGDILCNLSCEEDISGIRMVKIESEGEILFEELMSAGGEILEFQTDFSLKKEASTRNGCQLDITITDFAGNTEKISTTYLIDKTHPSLFADGVQNGTIHREGITLSIAATDNMPEKLKLYYCAKLAMNGTEQIIEDSAIPCEGDSITYERYYEEDGTYKITVYTKDQAGNSSDVWEREFRIDRTVPRISASGVVNGTAYNTNQTLHINIEENFFLDSHVSVTASRSTPNGKNTDTVLQWMQTGRENENSYSFEEDGDYVLQIKAEDAAGNVAQKEIWFQIDKTSPILNIEGIAEQSITNRPPDLKIHVEECFYEAAKISCLLIKKTENGVYVPVSLPDWKLNKQTEEFILNVKEEGVYELRINITDRAGNSTMKNLKFSLDVTPPVIGFLDTLNRKYLKRFGLPSDFAKRITDMSAVSYRTYLNTRNYNEKEEIVQDGKYILTVEAEDAAGNMSEKTIEFIVDRTLPRIIVSGLREDGTVGKGEKVILRLFDEQDRFVQVLLNGAEQVIDEENQQVILPMEAYGDYKITVKAIDPAENELTQIIDMSCALAVNPFEGYKVIEKTIRQEEEGMKNTWKSKELKPGRIILAAGIIVSILMVTVYIKFVHSQSLKCACNKQQRRTH